MTERPGGIALNAPAAPNTPHRPRDRGRGARSNVSGRFETYQREAFDDGWNDDEAPPARATTVLRDATRSIIARNNSPDIFFDQSVNPYRGCEHGCIYCFARPSHAYLGYSPGLDFETILLSKPDAPELLARHFDRPAYRPQPIVIGANTDAWQPVERRLEITREILKVFARYRHPLIFITKSALVLRDMDILAPMARDGLARGAISITTLDRRLSRDMEPRAAAPHRRLETIAKLADTGIPATVMMAPIVPALTDHEIEPLLSAASKAGATGAGYVLLRLPREIGPLFKEWLADARPEAAARVMSRMRDMRQGRDYDARWAVRGRGTGEYARLIARRFRLAMRKHGLNTDRRELDYSLFARPLGSADQPSLF